MADAVAICTLDRDHAECFVACADLGYSILCEKPLGITPKECMEMIEAVERNQVIFAVGHVLRYSPYNLMLRKMLDDGAIGDLVNVVHVEPVGNWHFAHSVQRWQRSEPGWERNSQTLFAWGGMFE